MRQVHSSATRSAAFGGSLLTIPAPTSSDAQVLFSFKSEQTPSWISTVIAGASRRGPLRMRSSASQHVSPGRSGEGRAGAVAGCAAPAAVTTST